LKTTTQEITLPGGKVTEGVFSKPMHNTESLVSTLEISIYNIENPANKILQSRFRAELVLKAAPSAFWGVYNKDNDPMQVNQPAALLHGKDGTINLVQAVRILPPEPFLCPSPIVDFDAPAAMRKTIEGTYFVLPTEQQGTLFCGSYFEPDVPDDDATKQTQRWADFADLWSPDAGHAQPAEEKNEGEKKTEMGGEKKTVPSKAVDPTLLAVRAGMVEQIAKILEWTIRPPEQMTGNGPLTISTSTTSAGGNTDIPEGTTSTSKPSVGGTGGNFGTSSDTTGVSGGTTSTPGVSTALSGGNSGISDAPKPSKEPNTPRVNADGRTDWELLDFPPVELVKDLDTYYPQLPFVYSLPIIDPVA
jgi:hypothetical protein